MSRKWHLFLGKGRETTLREANKILAILNLSALSYLAISYPLSFIPQRATGKEKIHFSFRKFYSQRISQAKQNLLYQISQPWDLSLESNNNKAIERTRAGKAFRKGAQKSTSKEQYKFVVGLLLGGCSWIAIPTLSPSELFFFIFPTFLSISIFGLSLHIFKSGREGKHHFFRVLKFFNLCIQIDKCK